MADGYSNKGRTYIGHEDASLEKRATGRYMFSLNFIKTGDVCLDAASGSGYGTALIAGKAKKVIGLEYDVEAIEYAKTHFNKNNIIYKQANLEKPLDLPDCYFDVIVSIETLEHIKEHDNMMREFKRVLKPSGRLIMSTVERHIYTEKGGIKNPHHIGELNKKELMSLVFRYFLINEIYGQVKYVKLSIFKRILKGIWIPFIVSLGKIDILKLRYRIMKLFQVSLMVDSINSTISTMENTEIVKTDCSDQNDYYQLLIVASNY